MNAELLWSKIYSELFKNECELKTVPKIRRKQLCFKAYIDNNCVYVYNSKVNKPSTNMTKPRKIRKQDFLTVYSFYHPWINSEAQRKEVTSLQRNTAYIFGLISRFEKVDYTASHE